MTALRTLKNGSVTIAVTAHTPRRTTTQQSSNPTQKRQSGFTLLEMLLVTILTATLMSGIWGISSLYLGLLKSGKRKTEEAQLVRTLTRLISDDLLGVVQPYDNLRSRDVDRATFINLPSSMSTTSSTNFDSAGSSTSVELQMDGDSFSISAASALPEFELIGTEQELRLNVLQVVHPDSIQHAEANADVVAGEDIAIGQPIPIRVPELKTIVYSFEEPRESTPNDRRPPVGLMRRELPWEQTFSSSSPAKPGRQSSPQTNAARVGLAPVLESRSLEFGESVTIIPEVVSIEFRYFDGMAWGSKWNSRSRNSLPVAVEVVLRTMSLAERQLAYGTLDERGRVDREPGELSMEMTPALGRVYRKLIFLAAGRNPDNVNGHRKFGPNRIRATSNSRQGESR